ncbi:pyruvate dehydrogenase complex dihydrolipoamide acetyltransferase [Cryomorpha ignava]|uniref:Acetyltransferase component of pyruvate dehydrogenase complex n=1 Tax=Cryomorpha ignava TaxID=101383 RepID=A0A7K3WQR2_9FLAO|nr:pyruvate dehydrogenase complex dihydrolipoamide acetyltransferase [Cryomorpha ignava]NEN24009.1 pyruvate dehydrogenase complex dihydrolipoamide acetyltransferase [Cryomorpha ignava]
MAEVVRMPKLSDTMEEGVVAEWHKKVGDNVESGDLLAEIETDKATMEFESFQDGVLLHIGVEKGDSAPVDSILAILGEKGEDISDLLEGEGKTDSKKKEKKEDSEDKEEKEKSESQSEDESAESEKDKAKNDSEKDGSEDDDSEDEESDEKAEKSKKDTDEESDKESEDKSSESTKRSSSDGRIIASPLAKRLASEKGIDISEVQGSGDGGRIIKKDVENFKPSAKTASAASASVPGKESYTEETVSQMRKTIAKRLAESKFTAPHFYLTMEIDMENAMSSRKAINEAIEPSKISINDMVIKAVAAALKKNPKVNSSWLGDKIRHNEHVHIGVAVAVDEGLLVPVIRHADQKSMVKINEEVVDFAGKARSKKLQPKDWEGNTFTVSNLGMYGIEEFTAIINPPDACIMAIGTIVEKPVVRKGQIVVGHTMKVTLSCDHRVVDGAVGSQFLNTFKRYMENPVMMLAE